jgi:hypothetical protein
MLFFYDANKAHKIRKSNIVLVYNFFEYYNVCLNQPYGWLNAITLMFFLISLVPPCDSLFIVVQDVASSQSLGRICNTQNHILVI